MTRMKNAMHRPWGTPWTSIAPHTLYIDLYIDEKKDD